MEGQGTRAIGHSYRGIRTVCTAAGEGGSVSQGQGPVTVQMLCPRRHSHRLVAGKRPYQKSDQNADESRRTTFLVVQDDRSTGLGLPEAACLLLASFLGGKLCLTPRRNGVFQTPAPSARSVLGQRSARWAKEPARCPFCSLWPCPLLIPGASLLRGQEGLVVRHVDLSHGAAVPEQLNDVYELRSSHLHTGISYPPHTVVGLERGQENCLTRVLSKYKFTVTSWRLGPINSSSRQNSCVGRVIPENPLHCP